MNKIHFIRRILLIFILFFLTIPISSYDNSLNEKDKNFDQINSNSIFIEPTCSYIYPPRIKKSDLMIVDTTLNSGSSFDIVEDDSLILYVSKNHGYNDPIDAGLTFRIYYNGDIIYTEYIFVGSTHVGLAEALWEIKMPEGRYRITFTKTGTGVLHKIITYQTYIDIKNAIQQEKTKNTIIIVSIIAVIVLGIAFVNHSLKKSEHKRQSSELASHKQSSKIVPESHQDIDPNIFKDILTSGIMLKHLSPENELEQINAELDWQENYQVNMIRLNLLDRKRQILETISIFLDPIKDQERILQIHNELNIVQNELTSCSSKLLETKLSLEERLVQVDAEIFWQEKTQNRLFRRILLEQKQNILENMLKSIDSEKNFNQNLYLQSQLFNVRNQLLALK